MVRLENDPFLNELTELYTSSQTSGTIYITFKQFRETKEIHKGGKRKLDQADGECLCLVRARSPQKKNIHNSRF